jgi:hypothetical protein
LVLSSFPVAEEIVVLMFLPFQTSIQPRRTPYATYALIGLNVVIFVLELGRPRTGVGFPAVVEHFWLGRASPWWTCDGVSPPRFLARFL